MVSAHSTTALVTGASRGMGLGYAKHYATAGWRVIATGTTQEASAPLLRLQQSVGDRLVYQRLEVTEEPSIAALASRIEELDGFIDLLINNAGVSISEPFDAWRPETFLRQLQVNAVGPALLTRAMTPWLRRGAKVVNVTSGLGSLGLNVDPAGDLAAYAASKAAMNQLTRRLAAWLGPRGVTVVAINPGWVQSEMGGPEAPTPIDEAVAEIAATIGYLTPEHCGCLLESDGSAMPF